jgi:hypothetical protein
VTLRERRDRHRRRPVLVRLAVALVGFGALAAGLALLVLPGPGLPLVAAGLGLLALEFRWAEAALQRALRVRPKRRSHRIAATTAATVALAASVSVALLWGLPGF